MKKNYILIGVVILGIVAAVLVVNQKSQPVAVQCPAPGEPELGAETSTQSVNPPLPYRNDAFGFMLDFPKSWQGYSAQTTKYDTGIHLFTFGKGGQGPVATLQVIFVPKKVGAACAPWSTWKDGEGVLVRDSYYVEVSGTDSCVQLDAEQCKLQRDIPAIIETFRFQ